MSKLTIAKLLETLKILLGVAAAIATVWNYLLPVDPQDVITIIDIVLAIIGGAAGITLAVSGKRGFDYISKFGVLKR